MENKKNLSGIGGWLLFLIVTSSISLVLEPLMILGIFANQETTQPNLLANVQWQNYKFILEIILLFIFIFKLFTLHALIYKRHPKVITLAKKMLWLTGPIAVLCAFIVLPAMMIDGWHLVGQEVSGIIGACIVAFIWTSYLNKSVRVKNTYGLNLQPTTNNAVESKLVINNEVRQSVEVKNCVDEDKIYEEIADELDGGNINKAVWTKSYAFCGGDENKTRSHYINLRFNQLKNIQNNALETTARISASNAALSRANSDSSLKSPAHLMPSLIENENESDEFENKLFWLFLAIVFAIYLVVLSLGDKKPVVSENSPSIDSSVAITSPAPPPAAPVASAAEVAPATSAAILPEVAPSGLDYDKILKGDFSGTTTDTPSPADNTVQPSNPIEKLRAENQEPAQYKDNFDVVNTNATDNAGEARRKAERDRSR